MSANEPLKLEELIELADEFFPSFNEIHSRMPAGASVRETLQVWDKIAELAAVKKKLANNTVRLGFTNVTDVWDTAATGSWLD